MKHLFQPKAALLSAGLSASGSAGLFCLLTVLFSGLGPIGTHPLDVGFGFAGGIVMLMVSILLLCLYVTERKKHLSLWGILLDLILLVVLFLPFFLLWGWIEALLSRIF